MSRMPRPTGQVGLYDPQYEHDACGVAFVARLNGEPTHETVQRAVVALANLEHRGAAGADPNTGDGAGILLQMPDELMRGVIGTTCRRTGAYGVCVCFLPQDEARRAELAGAARAHGDRRGPARGRLARHPGRQGLRRHHRQLLRAVHQAARRRRRGAADGRPGRLRAQALRDPPRRRAGGRARARDPVVLVADRRLQGHAHGPAAARLLPRPAGHADQVGARARPLAVLDEHVPELGARAPVPDDRPQRRDQHAARQRELDARARVAARVRAVRRGPAEGAAGRPAGRLGLGDVRQRARAAHARRPQPPARDDDDDPGGLRGPRRHPRRPQGLLRVPLVPDGAVGRPGGGRVHRRPRDRRDARPQRSAPRPLAGDQGRLGRARLGDRRDRRAARERPAQGPPAARQPLPGRPRARPDRRGRRGQGARSPRASRTREWFERGINHLADLPDREPAHGQDEPLRQLQIAFGYTQEDLKVLLAPTAARGEEPIGSMGNDLVARRAQRQPPAAVLATSSSCSRRSRTRRSTRSARRS